MEPRGCTALLDAVGRSITETDKRLVKIEPAERPGLVAFVIVTDGHENSSREFSKGEIKRMIEHRQESSGWQFTFLGANQDAFAEARRLGIREHGVAGFTADRFQEAYASSSARLGRMRTASYLGEDLSEMDFLESERRQMGNVSPPRESAAPHNKPKQKKR